MLDLLPMLRKAAGCDVVRYRSARRAGDHRVQPSVSAIRQSEAAARAAAGDRPEGIRHRLGRRAAGLRHVPGRLLHRAARRWRTTPGMEAFTSQRDLEKAKKLVAESGYKGEKIVMMAPSDQPSLVAPSQVPRELFIKLGLNVDYQVMDWGTLVARRAKQDPPSQGRLERLPHHLGRAGDVQSRQFLSAARQRQERLVRLADRPGDGGAARPVVRRAGHGGAEDNLRADPVAGVPGPFHSCRSANGIIHGRSART